MRDADHKLCCILCPVHICNVQKKAINEFFHHQLNSNSNQKNKASTAKILYTTSGKTRHGHIRRWRDAIYRRGFKGICCRYNIIIDALVDTTTGNTPSRMVERLEKNDIHVNERTICRWMDNYSELIETHTKNIKFQTSGRWRGCARLLVDCH